jgi:hypothetical protein
MADREYPAPPVAIHRWPATQRAAVMMKRLLPYAVMEYRMPIDEDATGSAHHRPNSASRSYPPFEKLLKRAANAIAGYAVGRLNRPPIPP